MMKPLSWLLLLSWPIVPAHAALYSPRILSPHNADTYSLKTFAQFNRWRDLSGDAKVYEVFKYLADRRTGLYPMGVPAREGREDLPEYGAVTDPVKMLNVYPIGHCGTLGPTAAGLWEGMGLGPARTLILPGWNHVAAEVFWEGRWHYFDLDVRAVFRREDGTLASMGEARADASLWRQPNSPLFFPLDNLESVRRTYAATGVEHRYGVASGGHTMDFVLRQGETFTRWWKPQGGRWNHQTSYATKPFPRSVIERAPRGPKSKHESFTIHTYGNGRFVYRPELTMRSSDFEDGVYDAHNVQPGSSGLMLQSPGEGYAIFEVRTPYVIVPLVGDLDTTADDREASVVKLEGVGVSLSLSLDNGLSWQALTATNGTLDLTPQVAGRYGYLLKLALRGWPGEAMLRSLEIVTWVQVHPASLPALRAGKNTMRLVTGDHYDLPTRVMAICPTAFDAGEFLRHLVEAPRDYDPARRTSRVRGSFVAKVEAPPGTKIAWISAGGSFTAKVGAAPQTRNGIAWAVTEAGPFRDLYRAEVPSDQSHWHYNVDREVRLDEPVRKVFVRYTGDPAVNNVRLSAHCVEDLPRARAPLVLTHVWTESGVRKSKQAKLDGPGDYEIEVNAEPVDESIELAIPSVARTAKSPAPVLDDPLQGSTTGTRSGGIWVAGGWQVTGKDDTIYWHVPTLVHGAAQFDVRGLQANDRRPGMEDKTELFHMYDHTVGDADRTYSGGYRDNAFKHFIRKIGTLDAAKTDAMEILWQIRPHYEEPDTVRLAWDPNTTYRFREEWGPDGKGQSMLKVYRDGKLLLTTSVPGAWVPVGHTVRLGASPRRDPTAGAPVGAVFSNVKVWNLSPATNLVRLRRTSLCDDAGPFLGLGISYFQALRHAKYDRDRLNRNLGLFAAQGFNYVRILSMVSWDGLEIVPVTFTNRAGRVVPAWPDYWQQFRDLLDLVAQHGLRTEVTLFADAQYVMPSRTARQAHLDGVLANIAGREAKLMHLEVANEAWQNGFPGAQGIADLRAATQYLADRTSVLVAITSNDDTSDPGIMALYRGSAADLATVHFSRDTRTPEGGWLPVRDSYRAGNLSGVPPVSSNEPIGPGSSVSSESDPIKLCAAAVFAYLANLPTYVFHSRAGVYARDRFEDTPGLDAFLHLREILPPDLASWMRNDGLEFSAPFTVFCDGQSNCYWPAVHGATNGCHRNIGSAQGSKFVCFPMGILAGGVTLEARRPVQFEVIQPLTGATVSNLTLNIGERFTLVQGPGAYILKGTFRSRSRGPWKGETP